MIILIDNYDSFTWNLWHFLKELGAEVNVFRNDEINLQKINKMNPIGIVISPGPGIPENAGITIELIKNVKAKIPILGVCLGHQAIGVAFGAKLKRINPPIHGKTSKIIHNKLGILNLIPNQRIKVTRYHSLIIDENRIPKELDITAKLCSCCANCISFLSLDSCSAFKLATLISSSYIFFLNFICAFSF